MLSGDLSTLLAGRYVEIRVHPLTYPEFLEFHGLEDSDDSLMIYPVSYTHLTLPTKA